MKSQRPPTARPAQRRRQAAPGLRELHARQAQRPMMAELYRRAEAQLRKQTKVERSQAQGAKSAAGPQRLLHELEVHQIELELQNAELQRARNELEELLENYTDLYDFAPVGYLSVDESGAILEANLTAATLLGVERSRLLNRRLQLCLSPVSRADFLAFLKKTFTGESDDNCEALLEREDGGKLWINLRATLALSLKRTRKWCRVAFADISARKQAEAAERHLEAMTATNLQLKQEIDRRLAVEKDLKQSEQHQKQLADQARYLTHRILHAQEEERKRISRELHDEIAQTLVGINVHLAGLTRGPAGKLRGLQQKIRRTQRLVEKSVDTVHRFARELRPTALDDLGLIPTLHAFMKEFTKRTGVRAQLTTFAAIEKLEIDQRTVLYRVAHEALNNVAHHARANQVEVSIEKRSDRVWLTIKDDGKSFNVKSALQTNGGRRLGLLGMRERLEMVGGSFAIESAPGHGTTVIAQIPFSKARAGGGARNPHW